MRTTTIRIAGSVEPGFEPVRDAFVKNFELYGEIGAAFCLYRQGNKVVDLWGGTADVANHRPYDDATLQVVFSATKGAVAVCIARLIERGILDRNAPVCTYWPEFAAQGKADIPVSWLLSHQAGLPSVNTKLTTSDLINGTAIVKALAQQKPLWKPGTAHGYHALTFGWLAGELIRRVTGQSVGEFFAQEVAQPLGLDFYIGLPQRMEERVAPLIDAPPPSRWNRTLFSLLRHTRSLYWRTLTLDGTLNLYRTAEFFNRQDVHAAELPAANGITNARSLARLYAATIGEIDGVRLFTPQTHELMTFPYSRGQDRCVQIESRFGLGFGLKSVLFPYGSDTAFGHYGISGAFGYADPSSSIAMGYVINHLSADYTRDVRIAHLLQAIRRCI